MVTLGMQLLLLKHVLSTKIFNYYYFCGFRNKIDIGGHFVLILLYYFFFQNQFWTVSRQVELDLIWNWNCIRF